MHAGPDSNAAERLQQEHYDRIASEYDRHYSDETSREYRRLFWNERMTVDLELSGRQVLEAMCGMGSVTDLLLRRGACVTGLDISEAMMAGFLSRWPEARAVTASLLDTRLPAESFDVVIVVGGLHHLQPHVDAAIDEIHRLLKPGGHFCFVEPHAHSLPDRIRRIWYRFDPLFERNEQAVDLKDLELKNGNRFEFVRAEFGGDLAYLFVLNSMVFRIPLGLKRFFARPLIAIERVLQPLHGPVFSCFVVAQWRKRP